MYQHVEPVLDEGTALRHQGEVGEPVLDCWTKGAVYYHTKPDLDEATVRHYDEPVLDEGAAHHHSRSGHMICIPSQHARTMLRHHGEPVLDEDAVCYHSKPVLDEAIARHHCDESVCLE